MAGRPAAALEVGAVIPEVKGTSLPELAPENAGAWVDAVASAVAVELRGFRTLARVISQLAHPYDTRSRCLPIDDVDYATSDQYIRGDDSGTIGIDGSVDDGDCDILASESSESGV